MRSVRVSSAGALACRFALRLASPRRLAAALAPAAPSEDTLASLHRLVTAPGASYLHGAKRHDAVAPPSLRALIPPLRGGPAERSSARYARADEGIARRICTSTPKRADPLAWGTRDDLAVRMNARWN